VHLRHDRESGGLMRSTSQGKLSREREHTLGGGADRIKSPNACASVRKYSWVVGALHSRIDEWRISENKRNLHLMLHKQWTCLGQGRLG